MEKGHQLRGEDARRLERHGGDGRDEDDSEAVGHQPAEDTRGDALHAHAQLIQGKTQAPNPEHGHQDPMRGLGKRLGQFPRMLVLPASEQPGKELAVEDGGHFQHDESQHDDQQEVQAVVMQPVAARFQVTFAVHGVCSFSSLTLHSMPLPGTGRGRPEVSSAGARPGGCQEAPALGISRGQAR